MSEKFYDQSPRKTNYLALGVGAGMIIGAGLGIILGNVDFVMALGAVFGAILGTLCNHCVMRKATKS